MKTEHKDTNILTSLTGNLLLITFAFIFFLPILVTILTALRTNKDILTNNLWSLPNPVYLEGFKKAWFDRQLGLYVKNSLIVTIPAVLGSLFCSSLAAHAIANFRFRMRTVILLLFFAGLWFPPQTFLVPVYFLAQKLRIYNTYLGLIIAHIAYALPFAVLVLSRFFETIPKTVIDAARIDGATEIKILTKIVWPLSIPALGAVSIFQFTWIWNDFYWGLVMTESPNVQPIMVGMTSTVGRYLFDWNGESASSLIALFIPLLIFVFFQRFFIEGVKMGSIK